ncbi:hypothetical protein VTI74DRAFT_2343 [Chaetomium olivicolor]
MAIQSTDTATAFAGVLAIGGGGIAQRAGTLRDVIVIAGPAAGVDQGMNQGVNQGVKQGVNQRMNNGTRRYNGV